ncbi:hypothetical protein [Stutzerimonas nitrititolerans]|uniref:hypothetical protein n=1 Tax=Stutzerimonas nitrititolerans TaxID=2482751 RepID=UPI0028A77034|nr:hypothetical protein [Stutzerimonas nitrititolerans]
MLSEFNLPLKLLNMSLFRPQTGTKLTEFIVFLVRCSHVLLQLRLTDLQGCNRLTTTQYLPVSCDTRQHNQQQTAADYHPRQANHVHALTLPLSVSPTGGLNDNFKVCNLKRRI